MAFRINNIRFDENRGFRPVHGDVYEQRRQTISNLGQELLRALGPVIGGVNDVHVNVQTGNRLVLTNNTTQRGIPINAPSREIQELCEQILNVANACFEQIPDAREPAPDLRERAAPVPEENDLNDQIRALQNEIYELHQQHEQLRRAHQDHVNELSAENAHLQHDLDYLHQQNHQLQQNYEPYVYALQEEINQLSASNGNYAKVNAQLNEWCDRLLESAQADKAEITALKDELAKTRDANQTAGEMIANLNHKLTMKETTLHSLACTHGELRNNIEEQTKRFAELAKKFQKLETLHQNDRAYIEEMNPVMQNLRQQLESAMGELETLRTQNQKTEALAQHFKGTMNQAMADREELENQLLALQNREAGTPKVAQNAPNGLGNDGSDRSEELDKLIKQKVLALDALLKEKSSLLEGAIDQKEMAEAHMLLQEKEIVRLKNEGAKLEAAIFKLQSEIAQKKGEISALGKDKDTALADVQKLAALFDSQNKVMKDLENRLNTTNDRIEQVTEKLNSAQKAKEALEHQAVETRQEKQKLNAQLAESTSERDALLKQIDELTKQHTRDQKLLFQTKTELGALQDEIGNLREQLDDAKRLAALRSHSPQLDQNGAEQVPSENIGILAQAEAYLRQDAEEQLAPTNNTAALQSKLDELVKQYETVLATIGDLEEKLERTEQEKNALQDKVAFAEKLAFDAQKRVEELTKELESYKTVNNDNSELKKQLAALLAERQKLQEKLTVAEAAVSATNKQLIEANQKNQNLTNALNGLLTDNSRLTVEIEMLTKDLEKVKALALQQETTIEQLQNDLRKEQRNAEQAAEGYKENIQKMKADFEGQLQSTAKGRALLAKQLLDAQAQADADRVKADAQMQLLVAQYQKAYDQSETSKARLVELQAKYDKDLTAAQQKQKETEDQRDAIANKASEEIRALAEQIKTLEEQAEEDSKLLERLTTELNNARSAAEAAKERYTERIASLEEQLKKAEEDLKAQEYQHSQVLQAMRKELDKALEDNKALRAEITKTKSVVQKAMQDTADIQATKEKNKNLEDRITHLKSEVVTAKADAVLSQTALQKAQSALQEERERAQVKIEDLQKKNGLLVRDIEILQDSLKQVRQEMDKSSEAWLNTIKAVKQNPALIERLKQEMEKAPNSSGAPAKKT